MGDGKDRIREKTTAAGCGFEGLDGFFHAAVLRGAKKMVKRPFR